MPFAVDPQHGHGSKSSGPRQLTHTARPVGYERLLCVLRRVVWDRPVGMTEITIQLDDSTSDKISYSSVGFLKFENNNRDATPAGTGVFARLGKVSGIITAGHVLEYLPRVGRIGLVRFPGTDSQLQNYRIEMLYTDRIVQWSKVEGDAPDLGFLLLPEIEASAIEARGAVFYNIGKSRNFVVSSPHHRMAQTNAIVGVVAEWAEEVLVAPRAKKKIVGGLFGAAQITKEFKENNTDLIEIEINYSSSPRIPESYEGVSGSALWELHVELDGTKVVSIAKRLYGIAFRQSKESDHHFIVSNGPSVIEGLKIAICKKWPDASTN
jgi:hypothetical protein